MDRRLLRASYDRSADTYDAIFTPLQRPKILALRDALPADAQGPTLDVGAGTGLVARLIGGDPVQVDLSLGMLARATGRRALADLHALPFPDAVFGIVWSVTSLIDFVDPAPAVRELIRVLSPGGYLAISVLAREDCAALERALAAVGPIRARVPCGQDQGFIAQAPPRL